MDTQSEQAPHAGSRRGNDRCILFPNFFYKNAFFSCRLTRWWTVVVKIPKIKTLKIPLWGYLLWSVKQHWRDYLPLAPPRWVECYFLPHLVFVVSPWRDDLYYLGWEIKEGFSYWDPMKLVSYKPWVSALIAQLPRCTAKCGHEAKQWKKTVSL